MRILGYINSVKSGCGYHRVWLPLLFAGGHKAKIVNFLSEEILSDNWDVLLLNRMTHMRADKLAEMREKYGFKIVVDVDDVWKLNPGHILYYAYKGGLGLMVEEHLKIADYCLCTHERLAREVRKVNPNVLIVPNAIPFDFEQFSADRTESERVRIFWAGGVTHEKDLEILRYPMKKVYGDSSLRDKVSTVFGGYSNGNKNVYDKMVNYLTCGLQLRGNILPAADVHGYMNLYKEADIMVVPLQDNDFNANKSILKVLEAATKKIPCIVSRVAPYTEIPEHLVNWVDRQGDWYKHIKNLVNDPAERKRQGEALYQWAKENYNLHEVNKLRLNLFESLCSEKIKTA